jgi:hypothetical protein
VTRRLARGFALGLLALAASTGTALGHSLNTTYESRLPLAVYLAGAAIAVALSFAFVLLRDVRATLPAADVEARLPPAWLRLGLRAAGLVGWLWIVAQLVAGGGGDADVGTLFLWVYGWVGLALVSAFIGPAWNWLDPFTTLFDIGAWALRRAGIEPWEPSPYPRSLGHWPAVAGFAFFVWLELVMAQAPGRTLDTVLVGYTLFTLAMMVQFGRDPWRANGEVFSVWFGLLGRLAPFALVDAAGRVRRRPFASGLLEPGWTLADVVLIAFGTGSILFDGLSQITPWYEVFGAPGALGETVQLAGFLGLIAVAALGVSRLVGVAPTAAGLLPIAVGYLIAHYLTYLLIDGQRILVAISDPLQQGWDLFGTAFTVPSGDWLPPSSVWTIQLAAVVGGHMLGAWGGHVVARLHAPPALPASGAAAISPGAAADPRMRQVPLAVIMVALTTLTLWSLGQNIVRTPDQQTGSSTGIPVVATIGASSSG